VIRESFIQSGPVYIFLPLDLSAETVSADLLKTPIDTSPAIDEAAQNKAVEAIISAITKAQHPVVLIDALVKRFGASVEARELVKKLNVPFFSANMGKGVVDETEELYVGVWNGAVSTPGVVEAANKSDLVVTLGYLNADTNSAGFSRKLEDSQTIYVNPFEVVVRLPAYPRSPKRHVLITLGQGPIILQRFYQAPSLVCRCWPSLAASASSRKSRATTPTCTQRQRRSSISSVPDMARH
jgi:pyruvate decarboxylase